MQSKSNFLIQPLFQEIARRFGITLHAAAAASPKEILKLFSSQRRLPKEYFEKRIPSHTLLSTKRKTKLFLGSEAKKIIAQELGTKSDEPNMNQLKGMVAYPGNITGTARVIFKKEELAQFQKGEILITPMTSPEFVPAMKIAKAIITDEGGVLCHAAITAREFKIPCIIGTGKATSVFKTGDRLEVDAHQGIVRKIIG